MKNISRSAVNSASGTVSISFLLTLVLSVSVSSACVGAGARPGLKIGLVAQFEGRYRDLGYEVIYAARLAVGQINAAGGVAGHSLELVALDDGGDSGQAVEQARKLDTDPEIVAAIGHWLPWTTAAVAEIAAELHYPLLATATLERSTDSVFHLYPTTEQLQRAAIQRAAEFAPRSAWTFCDCDLQIDTEATDAEFVIGPPLWEQRQFWTLNAFDNAYFVTAAPRPHELPAAEAFVREYRAASNGLQPGSNAVLAFDAVYLIAAAIERSVQAAATDSIRPAIADTRLDGLSGTLQFGSDRTLIDPPLRFYKWNDGTIVAP